MLQDKPGDHHMNHVRPCATALIALLVACTADAAKAPIPVTDFARAPDFSQVTLSPDGRFVAALAPKPGKPQQNQLVIFDAATGKPQRALDSGPFELISRYDWVGHNRLLGSIEIKLDGLDTPIPTGELYAINADGSRPVSLFGFRAKANTQTGLGQHQQRDAAATLISTEATDPGHVLIATQPFNDNRKGADTSIETLDVISGSTRRIGVSPARNANFIADHAGQVRVAWLDRDGIETLLWTRAGNDAAWVLVNDPARSGIGIAPVGFNRDNNKLYVRSSTDDGPDAIELMDMATGKRNLVYRGKFADPGQMLPSADGRDYYAVITADGINGLHYFDEDSPEARLNKDLASQFPGRLVYLASFSADSKRAIVHEESDRNPGDYFLLDVDTHSARRLVSANSHIDPLQMRARQPISLKARDGLPLHGFLTLPTGAQPHPMLVLVHGGPFDVADDWLYDTEAQLFASRGYAVLQVNYRGSGGYGSRFVERGYRQWGLAMEDDLIDATHWAVAKGYAEAARLCIYGASYGGYAAIEAVVREPDLFRCAIGYAGVYDMRVQLARSDIQQRDSGLNFLHTTMGDNAADLLAHSPLSGVAGIKASLLLIHGGADKRVPFANFSEFTRALDAQHKSYETLVEPDEGHGFFVQAHQVEAYTKMLDFLDRSIGSSATPAR
jgi:dipeptidyl aminopeptidase/acylaminoacyl peptidase